MMRISNYIKVIFFSLWIAFTAYPTVSNAYVCDIDVIKQGQEAMNNEAKTALNNFMSKVDPFNTAAQKYIDNCKEPERKKKGAWRPVSRISAKARILGVSYGDMANWKYTAYNWQQEVPPAKSKNGGDCKALLDAVKAAQVDFEKTNNKAYARVYASLNINNTACTCDANHGNMMCQTVDGTAEELQNKGSCKSFSEYQSELGYQCPLCGIFTVILTTIATVSTAAWNAVADPLANVVKIFFLVLLAFEVLKAVAAPSGSKISSLAKNVVLLVGKIAITILLLSSPKYIYGYFLSPVIEGGLNMGVTIANASGTGGHLAITDKIDVPSDTFDSSVYDAVLSTVRAFGKSAATLPAIGRGLTCNAWAAGDFGLPDLSMWVSGLLLYIFGLMIWLAISFYMIDCTVQIGMLSGLVPLLVACWPFKLTEAYTFKGCKMLMNSFFSYVMLGIVLLLGTIITTQAVSADGSNINDMMTAIDNNDLDALKKMCSLSAFHLLVLFSCAYFALKLISKSNNLADQFSKGSGSSIGAKMGGMAMETMTNMGKGALKAGGRVAGSAGKHIADATGATALVNKGADKIKGGWQKGWAKTGQAFGLGKYQNQQTGSGKPDNSSNNPTNNNPNNPNNPNDPNGPNNNPNPNDQNNNPDTNDVNNNPDTNDANNNPDTNDPNVQVTQNDDGTTTEKRYDDDGKLQTESTKDKDGNEVWKSYNDDGSIKAEGARNADGSSYARINDEHGNIQSESTEDKDGNEVWKSYNDDGSVKAEGTKNADGSSYSRINDEHGNIQSEYTGNKDGSSNQKFYGDDQKLKTEIDTDKDGKETRKQYD